MPPEEHYDPSAATGHNQSGQGTTEAMEPEETAGTVISRYHLLQRIGEGGMGEVWLVEQKEPLRRRVALKLIKAGMNTREVIARFESERQALALMDHPVIAKVFDAGSTPQGAPYFVMEYVAGVPITAYCDNHRLSTRERLELFMHVCEGVQHAHQKAIIHRDLKPSNIMVTEVDGKAAPKIIDFGVAKALSHKLTADTMFTRVGALIGTPEYMSPEQANSSGEDIDTRTDVYSLGVIFYELLAGVPPIDLRKIAFEEFLRRLREEEPPKPSTKIRTQDPATSSELAHKRHTEPLTLAKQIRGDLDSIALKALEKDRSRRYGSSSELAADIGRYLRNEAVLAAAPSAAYRARKFARRYRGALVTACAFALVLIAAAAVSIRQSIRANSEAAVAQAVNDFLQNDLLAQASASTQAGALARPDPDMKVRTALDRAAAKIGDRFVKQPLVEASIRETIGGTYRDLGLYREGQRQVERALELRRHFQGEENSDTLTAMTDLATFYIAGGKFTDAEALLKKILLLRRRVSGKESALTAIVMEDLGTVYTDEGKYTEAEPLYLKVVEIHRRLSGEKHPNTLNAMGDLGILYRNEGNYQKAEDIYTKVLEIKRRVMGEEHPDTLITMNTLGIDYYYENKYSQAEELLKKTLESRRRVLGFEHPSTLLTMNNLALVYGAEGKDADAEIVLRQTLEVRQRISGPEHPDTLLAALNLGDHYVNEGKYQEAEALVTSSLETDRRVAGKDHPQTLQLMETLGRLWDREGKYAQAETLFASALESRARVLGKEHPTTLRTAYYLGRVRFLRHAYEPAEAVLRTTLISYQHAHPTIWSRYACESLLGATLAAQKNYDAAEPLLLSGYEGMNQRKESIPVHSRFYLEDTRKALVRLYEAWGKPAKAAEWRQQLTKAQ